MTVVSTTKDPERLTLVVVAEFAATPERVWEVWADPRKLERWWGPPTYPATFTRHEFVPGGQCRYYMTSPTDERHHGWWRIDLLDPPRRIEFANGFAGDDGEPVPGAAPAGAEVLVEPVPGGTRMTVLSRFVDVGQMELMLGMGMEEGMVGAIGQVDALLEPTAV